MLIRTNIYLQKQTINFLKQKAVKEKLSMAEIIRELLEKETKKQNKNWAKSLLKLAKKAGKSKIGDLSKKHNYYLYKKRS